MTPRLLAIIGSGETAPTMTSVHAELLALAGGTAARPVMLDTPYGFQENADDIAARSLAYFRDSVGTPIEVATFRDAELATPLEYEQMCARTAQAGWVFAGPGSPTYALRQWRGTRVPEILGEKLRDGGVVVFASAAAVGLGEVALPVYEIYKVGEPVRWLEGLDLVRAAGLRVAVIPHYNNAEGGTHDTRFCYMGERRLRQLEAIMPQGCDILGVDEHTAALIDLEARTLTVRGRGRVTWRRRGVERHWTAGDVAALDELTGDLGAAGFAPPAVLEDHPATESPATASPLLDQVREQRAQALQAFDSRDAEAGLAAILDLESTLHEWSRDTLESDDQDRGRDMLRELLVRLADLARLGTVDPRSRLEPMVTAVLGLRDQARSDRRFADADRLRDALIGAGLAVHDTPSGSTWELAESEPAPA